MTTPGGGPSGFDYTDDSVIARVSFDIPSSAVTDISQITQVMGAMRTQLEAVSRAQEDWLGYLQSVPQIAERANQAFRDLQAQIEGTENRIAVARNRYIKAVQEYNISVRTFPNNLTAMVMGWKAKANFTVDDEKAISSAPKIDFNAPKPAPAQ
jgi:LemA protein